MPDDGYEGDVIFKGVVKRGSRIFWEEAIGIKVLVKEDHEEPQTTTTLRNKEEFDTSDFFIKSSTEKNLRSSTEQQSVEPIPEIDVDFDTTRWSSNNDDQLSSSTPEYPGEPYERLEAEHGGWTEARNFGGCLTTVPLMMTYSMTFMMI